MSISIPPIERKFTIEERQDTNNNVRSYIAGTDILHKIDGPAEVLFDGTKLWYHNGKVHRIGGPAVEYADGQKEWYLTGSLHREDGPAITTNHGERFYYLEGKAYSVQDYIPKLNELAHEAVDTIKAEIKDLRSVQALAALAKELDIVKLKRDLQKLRDDSETVNKVLPNGGTATYIKGTDTLHCLTGPAFKNLTPHLFTNPTEIEEYWVQGKKHRTDGPALTIKSTSESTHEYWISGARHRSGDQPAQIITRGDYTSEAWYQHGELHRFGAPAWVERRAGAKGAEQWHQNGQLHRLDGPASTVGNRKEWFQHGKMHRLDGPAIEYEDGSIKFFIENVEYNKTDYWNKVYEVTGKEPILKTVFTNRNEFTSQRTGQLHSVDGKPARKHVNTAREEYYHHGVRHRESGPAYIDGKINIWYKHGCKHNANGPAVVNNGLEEYWLNNLRHRANGPAIIHKNGSQEYYVNGVLHRTDGPAFMDTTTKMEYWYNNHQLHRIGGPSIMGPQREEWHEYGLLHRLDGPAYKDGAAKIWAIRGIQYDTKEKFEAAREVYYNKKSGKTLKLNSVKKVKKPVEATTEIKTTEKADDGLGWGTAVAAIAGAALLKGLAAKPGVAKAVQTIAEIEKSESEVNG